MSRTQRDQVALAQRFHELHTRGEVLQVANAWDPTSARVLAAAGARAIATTSFGVALNNATADGEQLPWDVVVSVAAAIVGAVEVPVTVDVEAGRGATPAEVGASVAQIIETGAVGINVEDSVPGHPGDLVEPDEQGERLAAAREAGAACGVPVFVNARCDVYFGADVPVEDRLDAVLRRAEIYGSAGAHGLFLPGLLDLDLLRTVTSAVDLPVNVMVGAGAPSRDELVQAGVRRISQGGEPFLALLGTLKTRTDEYLAGRDGTPLEALLTGASLLGTLVE